MPIEARVGAPAMIDRFLYSDWDEAPAAMDFEMPYGAATQRCAELVGSLSGTEPPGDESSRRDAEELYLLAPAIVNVALNYRICVDFGLPLHPTEYIQIGGGGLPRVRYGAAREAGARRLFDGALGLARAAYRLDSRFGERAERFLGGMPPGLESFVYTSRADRYTWRGAEPEKVRALAAAISAEGRPSLIVGAAHGAIMPGLLLAEYLSCPLWFLRFSMFKRSDAGPVVSDWDEKRIRLAAADGAVVAFDEDSASGATLRILVERLAAMVPRVRSGVVIRHVSSGFSPDFVGRTWWD